MFNRNEITERNTKPARLGHHWSEMEEYQPDGGMWALPKPFDRDRCIRDSSELMANPDAFRAAMRLTLDQWPVSCEVAFTTPGLNLRAWIGHAGCYIQTGSPEETTRLGWHELDDGEQYGANNAADQVIHEWRTNRGPTDGQSMLPFDGGEDA